MKNIPRQNVNISSGNIVIRLPRKQLSELDHNLNAGFHILNAGEFEMAMAVLAAGSQVGTGQTHKGQASAIGAAANGNDFGFDIKISVYRAHIVD